MDSALGVHADRDLTIMRSWEELVVKGVDGGDLVVMQHDDLRRGSQERQDSWEEAVHKT